MLTLARKSAPVPRRHAGDPPGHRPKQDSGRDVDTRISGCATNPSEPPETGGRSPVVLVIDDDPGIREALGLILEDYDIPCVMAEHGGDALDRLRRQGLRPDIILLDLMMPVVDGWEFREVQLTDPELRRIPTVVLTAAIGAAQQTQDLSFTHVLRKPVDLDALLDTLQELTPGWQPDL